MRLQSEFLHAENRSKDCSTGLETQPSLGNIAPCLSDTGVGPK